MRVLIVHDYGTLTGGAEHVSKMLRDGLRERGHEAEWFASSARPLRVPIAADRTCFGTMSGLGRVTKIFNPLAAASLRSAIRDYRPDVVHLRMFMTQLSPWILSVLHRVPTIHHVVNYDLVCPLNVKRLPDGSPCVHRAGSVCRREGCVPWFGVARAMAQRSLTQRGFSALDRVVCNSGWVRRRLEREGWRVDDVIWNGVPVRPARAGLARRPTIAFAGRLFPKKGVDVLLHAFAAMRGEIEGARLVIAGDGPERAHLEGLAERLQLGEDVDFLGHLDQETLERETGGAWAQVVPSVWEEPFGLVAAEAQMRAIPVVASDSGGLTEIVEHGVTGLTFRTGSAPALTKRLLELSRDPERARALGRRGRERALRDFSESRMVARFEATYRSMIKGRPTRRLVRAVAS